jgi:hypothetical protein
MSPTRLLDEAFSLPWETVTSMLQVSRAFLTVEDCATAHGHAYEAAQKVEVEDTSSFVGAIRTLQCCDGCPNVDVCPLHNDTLQP